MCKAKKKQAEESKERQLPTIFAPIMKDKPTKRHKGEYPLVRFLPPKMKATRKGFKVIPENHKAFLAQYLREDIIEIN